MFVTQTVSRERGIEIDIRAGIHLGEVLAGVISQSSFFLRFEGDVINVASRMESPAPRGQIQLSEERYHAVSAQHVFAERGEVELKGKGRMRTWLLKGKWESATLHKAE